MKRTSKITVSVLGIILFSFGFMMSCADSPPNEAASKNTAIEVVAEKSDASANGSCPDLCREEWDYCTYTCEDLMGEEQDEGQGYLACMSDCDRDRSMCEWNEGNFVKQTGNNICHLDVNNYLIY